MAAIARRILAAAPPRFALAGLSMGGYIAFEIMRQAPERVAKLALLDTGARGDTPEQTERRKVVIALANSGRYADVTDIAFPVYVHRNRHNDEALRSTRPHDGRGDRCRKHFCASNGRSSAGRIRGPALARSRVRRWCWSARATRRRRRSSRARSPPEFPASRLVMIPDSGHLSTLERPQAVTAALVEWMSVSDASCSRQRQSIRP